MELCPMFGMIVVVRPMFSRMRVAVSFRLVLMVVRVLVLVQMLVVVYVAVFMTVRHVRVDMVVVSVLMTVGMFMRMGMHMGMFMVSFQGRTSSTEFSLHHIIMPVTFRVKQATEDIVLSRTLSAGRHTLDEPFDHTVGASRPAKVILK
jgi:hypothetical protein